ncbi:MULTISPECIES: helix-turn-helix domain-containing protein [unclassified Emticicia]|uniref:helix-turn-helix domain-containing protein n=1 Tax=unclassified Emticicia TaxID=2627301 RepID=UPI000C774B31|nr:MULTISPECIES: helix-turn-helix transcriptional regulator [unclassified Emticicia]PLK45016.1 XRE family transcriptional regulator [Emticicia sp. TH156]UTA66985.1 helix-turn-helix domain-containing protein [Emticicia sp. 21SJ11W-3]
MSLNTDNIRLVFGLKLKQLRIDKGMSLTDLAQKSGLSMSYINEIEKGKKYPKSDKIVALADAMGVDYDSLVSLKLNKKLEPISELLHSNFLTELPFEIFGISPADLLELLSGAPTKLSAFISTIIEIGRNYNMTVEQFYFAVMRSYQEMHDNYFPELEEVIDRFLAENRISADTQIDEFYLSNLLTDKYGIAIKYFDEDDYPHIINIRSVFLPKTNTLLINKRITSDQRAFTLGRELGFIYMKLKDRPYTSSWVEVKSFEEILNNFKASYFAGAILIRREKLIEKLEQLFNQPTWSNAALVEMAEQFQATPETLYHRISNVLPRYFGIDEIFFLRFEAPTGKKEYHLTKEMHLARRHTPHESQEEHYCRRWVSLNILDDVSDLQQKGEVKEPLVGVQISNYVDSGSKYLVMAMARPLNIIKHTNISVSVGFEINDNLRAKMKFLDDPNIITRDVNQTCERCSLFDCKERVAAPVILQKKRQIQNMKAALRAMEG